MLTIKRTSLIAVSIMCCIGLTACGSGTPSGNAPSAGQLYSATLSLQGQPAVTADGKDIQVTVAVNNTGSASFGSATSPHNVNLAAHSIDASGHVINNDLARGHLPQIAPGSTASATIQLPIDQVLGKRAELLPVQEQVAWFDQWGTKPLIVGPFNACSQTGAGPVCDAAGTPLPTVAAKP